MYQQQHISTTKVSLDEVEVGEVYVVTPGGSLMTKLTDKPTDSLYTVYRVELSLIDH